MVSTTLEWFWGVVLIYLLTIGCVERNPGPREAQESSVQEQYRASEASLANDLLRQQVQHLSSQLEREFKQRVEERKCYEDTIKQHRATQEHSRKLHEELYEKFDHELKQKQFLEQQLIKIRNEEEHRFIEETNRLTIEYNAKLEEEKIRQNNLLEQIGQMKHEKEDMMKIQTDLQLKIDEEQMQRKLVEKEMEEEKEEMIKYKTETERTLAEFMEKLNLEVSEKTLLKQEIENMKDEGKLYSIDDQIDQLKKEFQRRKKLEKDLENELNGQKTLAENLQQETFKRKQLEQQLRLQTLEIKTTRKEYDEQNQEQELQRRQLQHALEQEKIKLLELEQQLAEQVKQKQEIFRIMMKETEERHKVELQLQEEIQVRQELELEFKQADLQSQILEQELREQLTGMKRIFSSHDDDNIEVIPESNETQSGSIEISDYNENDISRDTDETLDETEEATGINKNDEISGGGNDNDDVDDDEKQEIRQLLLEEFQRLQIKPKQEEMPSDDIMIRPNPGRRLTRGRSECESCNSSLHRFFQEDGMNETNLTELVDHKCIDESVFYENDDHTRILPDTELNQLGITTQSDVNIRRGNEYLTMTLVTEDELDSQLISQRRKGILITNQKSVESDSSLLSHDDVDFVTVFKENKFSKILNETVNFQGRDVAIYSLIGEKIYPQTEALLKEFESILKKETKLTIGSPCLQKETHNYVTRILQRKIYVRPDIFKHRSSKLPTAFAVSGLSKLEFEKLIPPGEEICQHSITSGIENAGERFILLQENSAEADYRDLCDKARNYKAIHWLIKKNEGLTWKQSKGNIDIIRSYIDSEKNEEIFSIPCIEDEIILVTGNNGEGKSAYLTFLERVFKDLNPSSWIIRINADELLSQRQKGHLKKADVIDFLLSTVIKSSNSGLESLLLKHSLEITGNIYLLIDEINFKHRDKIEDLSNILKTMQIKKIVIAAHTCMKESLENSFSSFALTLKPIEKEELCNLLVEIWKTKIKNLDVATCKTFTHKLISTIQNSISTSNCFLTSLHMKMLSSIFEKELYMYLNSQEFSLPIPFSIFELYEKYLEMQLKIFCLNMGDDLENQFYTEIRCSSMLSIFSEGTTNHIFADFLKKIPGDLNYFKSRVIDKFPFLHQDLEEYILAKWFSENYQNFKPLIQETYFDPELQSLWIIFDKLLAKDKSVHTAVLDMDIQKLRNIVTNGSDLNSVDMGGRTALHLVPLLGKYHLKYDADYKLKSSEIMSILLNYNIDVYVKDLVFGWTALSYADKVGVWSIIEELLKTDSEVCDLIVTNKKLHNPSFLQETLTDAAVQGYVHTVAFILDAGVDINTPLHSSRHSHQQYSLIHIASENNHIPLLQFLIDNGAYIDNGIWDNSTPMHLACRWGQEDAVRLLLERNASVNLQNKKGNTPLHEAVQEGHGNIITILLSSHSDIDACNKDGETPFHIACRNSNLTAVIHLLPKVINKGVRNKNGDSPLDCAIQEGNAAVVKYILGKCKECLTVRKEDGRHPLHLAAMIGDVLKLEYLLEISPNVDVTTIGGDTPLHLASLHGKIDAGIFMLKAGADVNKPNNYGNTALHLSSLRGNSNVMNTLLEYQADVNANNIEGNTPLHLASLNGKENAVLCLLNHQADVHIKNREKNTSLQLAVEKGSLEITKILIEAGSNINVIDRYGDSILHLAVKKGRIDIIKVLTETGRCEVDIKNSSGDSPLILAVRSSLMYIISTLVLAGANINLIGDEGHAPLHIAVAMGDKEIVNLLIELGADINNLNISGNTPLHRAVYFQNLSIIQCLLNHGAKKDILNENGETPFDIAVQIGCGDSILHVL
ncbi:hypothetical protein C0J52_19671 [Blattella germanica]|nr:hypothetical protein C0J52_19671 [Blattella germanica]